MKKYTCLLAIILLVGGIIYAQEKSTKKAFLGVIAVSIDEVLTSHLHLDKNSGYVLKMVLKNSAADKAGLKKNDIILKANGEALDSSRPLSELINKFKPEETVKFSILRAGKPEEVSVTLGESVPQLVESDSPDRINIILPKSDSTDSVQVQILEDLKEMKELENKIRESFKNKSLTMDKELQKTLDEMAKKNETHLRLNGSVFSCMSMNDGEHEISIKVNNGNKTATVKDKDGKVVFDGDINTDAELQNIPQPIRDKIIKFQNNVQIYSKE